MKTFQQISSVVLLTAAALMMSLTILTHPLGWQTRLDVLVTFLVAFALACTGLLLCPHREPETNQP